MAISELINSEIATGTGEGKTRPGDHLMALRDNFMIGTAGHVDHGKTCLVHLLTGCETDTLREEKERGLSIDLGFAPCQLPDKRIIGIVDVPGHEKFIRNMVAGATGIDIALLVVAADDGVMPQTIEHLDVLLLLGVRHGLVALTKVDLVDEEQVELAREDVRELLAGTALEDAPICPVSSVTGEGFDGFFRALSEAASRCEPRPADGIFRLAAERAFSAEGFGTVATGIPSSGRVRVGDTLEVFDLRGRSRRSRVRRLEIYGREAQEGLCGQCAAVNLADVATTEVGRGTILATPGYVQPVEFLELTLRLVQRQDVRPLKNHSEVHFHTGTMVTTGRVAFLDETTALAPGSSCCAQIRLQQPLVVGLGDRFVIRGPDIRAGLRVIGGGRVVGTSGQRLKRRPWVVEALRRWEAALAEPSALLAEAVRQTRAGITPSEAAHAALLPTKAADALGRELLEQGILLQATGGRWLHRDCVEETVAKLCERLAAFHKAQPRHLGPGRDELREELDWSAEVLDLAIARGAAGGKLVQQGNWVRLPTHEPSLSERDRNLQARAEEALRQGGFRPPLPDELGQQLGVSAEDARDVLVRLAEQSIAVQVSEDLWFHRDAIVHAAELVRQAFAKRPSFTTMDFRDMLGTSRKYAVPMVDYFDALGLTRRSGNRRSPGPNLGAGAGPVPPAD